MKVRIYLILFSLTVFVFTTNAQTTIIEKTVDISPRSVSGNINCFTHIPNVNQYRIGFVTSIKKGLGTYEIYSFDKQLNFLTKDEMSIPVITETILKRDTSYIALSVDKTSNQLRIKKNKITKSKYSTFTKSYLKEKSKTQKTVSPRGPNGNLLFFHEIISEHTNNMQIIAHLKDSSTYCLAGIDDLGMVSTIQPILFEHVNSIIFKQLVNDSIAVIIIAPNSTNSQLGKNTFAIILYNLTTQDVSQISFESPAEYWDIEFCNFFNNKIYLFGPSIIGTDKYYDQLCKLKKWDIHRSQEYCKTNDIYNSYQLMKVENNEIKFVQNYSLLELQEKLVTPENTESKQGSLNSSGIGKCYSKLFDNDLFITTNNLRSLRSPAGSFYQAFTGMSVLHINNITGKLITQYNIFNRITNYKDPGISYINNNKGCISSIVSIKDGEYIFLSLLDFEEKDRKGTSQLRANDINPTTRTIENTEFIGGKDCGIYTRIFYSDSFKSTCLNGGKQVLIGRDYNQKDKIYIGIFQFNKNLDFYQQFQ